MKKDCPNAAISIAGSVTLETIETILHRLAHQPQTKYIENIWFTLDDKLYKHQLSNFK